MNTQLTQVDSVIEPDCPKCGAQTDTATLWDASIDEFDGDHMMMRATHSCDKCGIDFDVMWYATIHTVEVEV